MGCFWSSLINFFEEWNACAARLSVKQTRGSDSVACRIYEEVGGIPKKQLAKVGSKERLLFSFPSFEKLCVTFEARQERRIR